MPSTTTVVTAIPVCDLCGSPKGYADCRVPSYSTWANVCKPCFKRHGCKLGLGIGQEFKLAPSADALDNLKPILTVGSMAYDRWLGAVDKAMEYFIGARRCDLADWGTDWDYATAYAEGMSPGVAAAKAVAAAAKAGF